MARVTVEDCLRNVKNRFELVLIAAKRARQLMRGTSEPKVEWDNDKPTVVALREIAAGYTQFDQTHASDADDEVEAVIITEEVIQIIPDSELPSDEASDSVNDKE